MKNKSVPFLKTNEGRIVALACAAGYKLCDPSLVGNLTNNQLLFAAMGQEEYYSRMLAPYIDHSPSPEMLHDEERNMARMAKKYEGYKSQDWFKWDGEPLNES